MRLETLGDVALWETVSDSTRGERRLGPGKPIALLAYLAAAPGRRSSREHLVGMLWSDRPAEEARHVLRQVTWQLRRRLGEGVLATAGEELVLTKDIQSDRADFLHAVDQGRLEEALAMYRGEFLPAFATPGAAGFEQWAELERLRLRSVFVRASETVARQLLAAGQPRAAVPVARRARDADRLNTSAWRLLLETLCSAGDGLGAATEADALEQTFRAEGLELDAAAASSIRLARRLPADAVPDEVSHSSVVTDLVGREREFSTIVQAWERVRHGLGAQQVHVLGEAGIGKTRLVSDVVARLRATRARVAHVRAYPNHQSLPFGLLGAVVTAIAKMPGAVGVSPVAAASLVALAPSLTGSFPSAGHEQPTSHDEALRRRYLAVHELLVAVSDEAPLALVIDDLHWADDASRAAILAVLDRLAAERLLVVTTSRPVLGATEPPGLTLRLAPLSEEEVEALVASLGELPQLPWAEAFPRALHRATDGVPLFIIEVLQSAGDEGLLLRNGKVWAAPRPRDLLTSLQTGVALQQRAERLGTEARRVVLHLAVAGGPTPVDRLTASLRYADDALAAHVETLERGGYLKKTAAGLEVAHDSLGDVVIAAASAEDMRAAHVSIGAAIADEPAATVGDLVRAARHLDAAQEIHVVPLVLERAALKRRRSGDRRPARAIAGDLVREALGPEADAERSAILERHVRRRLTRPRRQMAAACGLVALSLGGWRIEHTLTAEARRPVASLLVSWVSPEIDALVVQLDLTKEMFDGHHSAPLELRSLGRRDEYMGTDFLDSDGLTESPAGGEWAGVPSGPLAGQLYTRLLLTRGRGAFEHVVRHLGKLRDPSWAPDGSAIVFARERYDGPGSELAVVEPRTKRIRVLTPISPDSLARHVSSDRTPVWGPDGTRIAFVRAPTDSEPGALCWTTADATIVRCGMTPTPVWAVRAWRTPSRVIVESQSGQRHDLSEIQVDSGRVRLLESDVGEATVSPDGRWVARRCRKPACGPYGWLVGPVGQPNVARLLTLAPTPAEVKRYAEQVRAGRGCNKVCLRTAHVSWRAPAIAPPYVSLAAVELGGFEPGEAVSFNPRWLDQHGQPIRPSVAEAYATEPDIADLDSARHVRWRQRTPSASRFVFSAGGWRADTVVWTGPDTLGRQLLPLDEQQRVIREAMRRWNSREARSEK